MSKAGSEDTKTVITSGTHRTRRPEETWYRISGMLSTFGITRVADVTGLDELGIPTAVAIRPTSETLSASQGKGATRLLARISAAFESIETWHAENRVPGTSFIAPVTGVDLGYDLTTLPESDWHLWTRMTPIQWIQASRFDGTQDLIPRDYVDLAYTHNRALRVFHSSSNGLASGNTRTEAILHGLYECVERDTIASLSTCGVEDREYLDLDSIADPLCAGVIDLLRDTNTWVEVTALKGRAMVPTFVAYIWSETFPQLIAGSGTHLDPAVALYRALSEAAQSRLTIINGTREDIPATTYDGRWDRRSKPRTPTGARKISYSSIEDLSTLDLAADLGLVAEMIYRMGINPLIVDLSDASLGLDVIKVVTPGMRFNKRHHLPRFSASEYDGKSEGPKQ